jgi:hypothetical protein
MTLRPHAAFASACGSEECATRTFCVYWGLKISWPDGWMGVLAMEMTERLRRGRLDIKEVKSPQIKSAP